MFLPSLSPARNRTLTISPTPQADLPEPVRKRCQLSREIIRAVEAGSLAAAQNSDRRRVKESKEVVGKLEGDIDRLQRLREKDLRDLAAFEVRRGTSHVGLRYQCQSDKESLALRQLLQTDIAETIMRVQRARLDGAEQATWAASDLLAKAADAEVENRAHSMEAELAFELGRHVMLRAGDDGPAEEDNGFDATALLEPPDWQNATPRGSGLDFAKPMSLSRVGTPEAGESRGSSRTNTPGLGATREVGGIPITGARTVRPPDINDIFSTPLKLLEHRSGRVPNISPVRPAAALLSGMPKMGHSKVSMFCGFYRSWETQASKCSDGPTKFDRERIFEHANRSVKHIPIGHPFQKAPPYVAPWEDPMENVDMSIKGLELIKSNQPGSDDEEEVEGEQADGTFKVTSLEDMQENLPGQALTLSNPSQPSHALSRSLTLSHALSRSLTLSLSPSRVGLSQT